LVVHQGFAIQLVVEMQDYIITSAQGKRTGKEHNKGVKSIHGFKVEIEITGVFARLR
jgi:hypothetical protein